MLCGGHLWSHSGSRTEGPELSAAGTAVSGQHGVLSFISLHFGQEEVARDSLDKEPNAPVVAGGSPSGDAALAASGENSSGSLVFSRS